MREVDLRLARLSEVRMQETSARTRLESEEDRLREAEEKRSELISRLLDAKSLALANDWLVACAKRRDLAGREVVKALQAVSTAQGRVLEAKNDLRKVELISERLKMEERVRGERAEQRMTDELSSLRFLEANRRRGEP
jgi:flagellar export protein FliJ